MIEWLEPGIGLAVLSREFVYELGFEGEVKSNYYWSDIYHVLGTCVFSLALMTTQRGTYFYSHGC